MAFLIFLVAFTSSIIGHSIGQNTVATVAPCCGMTIGALACQRLRTNNPAEFCSRCFHDDDFKTMQCCPLCRKSYSLVDANGIKKTTALRTIFPSGTFLDRLIWAPRSIGATNTTNICADRHVNDGGYCARFLSNGVGIWSCANSSYPQVAFRDCKKTCGYCNIDLYLGTDEVTSVGRAGPGPSPNCVGSFPHETDENKVGFCNNFLPEILLTPIQ